MSDFAYRRAVVILLAACATAAFGILWVLTK